MSWYYLAIYVLLAVTSISGIEYISRTTDNVTDALIRSAPLVLLSQYCLYYIFSSGSSIMAAWITFTIAMSVSRLLNSMFVLREDLSIPWLLVGITMMTLSGLCIKQAHN
ncbi:MAG TPA: hypothetical protein EYF98_04285 [Planctomycetes bacterium]|jgi:hypothetical protein|nr:hypothetical protein [Planctomycetota bacterium]